MGFGMNEASRGTPAFSVWDELKGVEFEQGYLDAGGIRTRYLATGSSDQPLLLMLHGIGGHAETYLRNLAPHGEHFRTVSIDMVGHGWTDKPDVDYEMPVYADHILKVLNSLGAERAHISGESLGGWVATHMAVHHPEVVDRLVLNTAGGWTAHPEVMSRLKQLSNQAASEPTWDFIKERLEWLMYDKSMVFDDLVRTRQAIYEQTGYDATMRRIMCLQEMEIRQRNMFSEEQYNSISAPTLVIWTSHDPTATPEEGKQISDMIPNAKYVVLNECGHWPQYEDAETFNRVHLEFLLGG